MVSNAPRMISLVTASVVLPPRALRGATDPLASRDRTERSVFAGIPLGYTQTCRADKDHSELRDSRSINRATPAWPATRQRAWVRKAAPRSVRALRAS